MSKELIRPEQFRTVKSKAHIDESQLQLNDDLQRELDTLYKGAVETFQLGKLITGTVIAVEDNGVLVDIKYKSRGLVPRYEFGEYELKKLHSGDAIEVILDQLEDVNGRIVLSYEKAKEMRAWDEVTKLFEKGEPVEGIVTHKVKGGLNVDVGIPAFLPGSQIDLQRVTDFDQYVGQTIKACILKLNKKRGNVIISRRKYLHDQRSEDRKKILETLAEGQVIQGVVKNITNYGVFIDIGGVDGLLHITDMTWGRVAHPSEMVRIGQTIAVKVLSFDKNNEKISLGLKQLQTNPWDQISPDIAVGHKIKGKISSITDYGLFIEVAPEVEGLVHISEISWTDRITDLHRLYKVGEEIEVLVVSLDKENRRMSLSVKQLGKNPWETVNEQFKPGQIIKGKISNITDFGVFVQLLPGIDGLVHISDLSWTEHIEHPSDRYKQGQEVEAVVLAIDKDNKKISLGIKQLSIDPWEKVAEEYPVGSIVEGEVSKITNFGAFIRLPNNIEGLVHNTVLSQEQGKKAEEIFKVGQKAQFRIVNINKEERKLALSTLLEEKKQEPKKVEPKKAEPKKEKSEAPRSVQAKPSSSKSFESKDRLENKQPAKKEKKEEPQQKVRSSLQIALESAMQKSDKNVDGQ
ncbi:MAG TPA: 30S ribosomal protein S1 [Candidatus Babeliales bacterium]|jgi:small subunit ribosomal protein S1|nr:30S ribosomal protein S1 [Candidatus Babeliales bacterium]